MFNTDLLSVIIRHIMQIWQ